MEGSGELAAPQIKSTPNMRSHIVARSSMGRPSSLSSHVLRATRTCALPILDGLWKLHSLALAVRLCFAYRHGFRRNF